MPPTMITMYRSAFAIRSDPFTAMWLIPDLVTGEEVFLEDFNFTFAPIIRQMQQMVQLVSNKLVRKDLIMKKYTLIAIALVSILGINSNTFSQQRETKPVRFEKMTENLYQILDGRGANGGAFIGQDAVLIIDAKMDQESVDQIIAETKKLTELPIKYLGIGEGMDDLRLFNAEEFIEAIFD